MHVAGAFAIVASACACGGSPTPGAPTPPGTGPVVVSVTLTPLSGIIVGQASAMVAFANFSDGHSQGISDALSGSWRSSNAGIATVSSEGIVTGIAPGAATITLSYGAQRGTATVTVTSGGTITSCGQFSGNGPFVIGTSLTSVVANCLTFSNGVGVQLDCNGQDIVSLQISNGQNFAVRHCLMHAGGGTALEIASSSQVTVDSVDVSGQVVVQSCRGCSFTNNVFHFPSSPCVTSQGSLGAPEVLVMDGQNNVYDHDTVDGGWPAGASTSAAVGCHTGVAIERESNVRLTNDTIRNASGTGIEGLGSVVLTATIQGNSISHVGSAAIAGSILAGWQNSTFSANTVSDCPTLFTLVNQLNGGASATFVGNQIIGNALTTTATSTGQTLQPTTIDFVAGGEAFTVTGNVIRGNNFGVSAPAPVLNPASGFTDGGGNVCSASTVLTCGPGTFGRRHFR
jgi:hypothetical protein